MFDQALPSILALLHLAFIAFVALGGFLLSRWRRLAILHLPAALWGVLIELGSWPCPLTRWENLALQKAGTSGYEEGFLAHYLFGLIYPRGLTRGAELALAGFVIVINAALYALAFRRRSGGRPGLTAVGRR